MHTIMYISNKLHLLCKYKTQSVTQYDIGYT